MQFTEVEEELTCESTTRREAILSFSTHQQGDSLGKLKMILDKEPSDEPCNLVELAIETSKTYGMPCLQSFESYLVAEHSLMEFGARLIAIAGHIDAFYKHSGEISDEMIERKPDADEFYADFYYQLKENYPYYASCFSRSQAAWRASMPVTEGEISVSVYLDKFDACTPLANIEFRITLCGSLSPSCATLNLGPYFSGEDLKNLGVQLIQISDFYASLN
jgi:hypothetical protein